MHPNFTLYELVLKNMEGWFAILADSVPPPVLVQFGDSHVYRYVEKTPQQAIVQKLARCVSGLDAANVLLLRGLLQEHGAMQRILGDIFEDVVFLSIGLRTEWTQRHVDYLAAFYQEEFDNPNEPMNSTQKRPMRNGEKIRAWLANIFDNADPSTELKAGRSISKIYSGYVHAASPHIMDMYLGEPPRFLLRNMLGTQRETSHLYDIWNYFYRGISAFNVAAFALGNVELGNSITEFRKQFEARTGRTS